MGCERRTVGLLLTAAYSIGGWALGSPLSCEVVFYLFEVHVCNVLTNSVALLSHECYGVKALLC